MFGHHGNLPEQTLSGVPSDKNITVVIGPVYLSCSMWMNCSCDVCVAVFSMAWWL